MRFASSAWTTGLVDYEVLTIHLIDYHQVITIEADKRSGKPCIRGMRMTVTDVLEYLAVGMTCEEILNEFPDLTYEDIMACLAFAADRECKKLAMNKVGVKNLVVCVN